MISNRQGGRRRGRGGGGRAPNLSTGGGNRQDNRQRGNAAQLLEKYKGLARDAQMQGDRVQTETYLQFADHYYRVLNESRARFDEQRRPRDDGSYDGSYEDEEQDEAEGAREAHDQGGRDQGGEEPEPRESGHRREPERESGHRREPERESGHRREARREGNGELRSRRPRGPRPDENDRDEPGDERIAADTLPPAISAGAGQDEAGPNDEERPRRRARRPRPTGEDIAPAA